MEHNYIVGWIPWPIAIATAIWFGVMAYKSGKNRLLWVIVGGVLGLAVSTIILGLGQAAFIPFHNSEIAPFRVLMTALAVLVVFCLGWLFSGSLHRHVRAIWKRSERSAAAAAGKPSGAEAPAKPPATALKR
jgi:high-affinity Fe2+/Pb2+ permease